MATRARTTNVKPTFDTVAVTPKLATQWLETNTRNRGIRRYRVSRYAADMVAGRWAMTGEPIKFSRDNQLLDGQHRLLAVVEAGVNVPMAVARGIDPEAQNNMDTGGARSAGDFLKINGYPNSNVLGCATKWAILYDRDALYLGNQAQQVTHAEIYDYVKANNLLADAVRFAYNHRDIDMSTSYVAACYFLCACLDEEAAFEFFSRLNDGLRLDEGSPILALRARLHYLRDRRVYEPGESYLSLTLRAWNLWREGKGTANLQVRRAGQPIRCPKPI
jgi:hypothetical protein